MRNKSRLYTFYNDHLSCLKHIQCNRLYSDNEEDFLFFMLDNSLKGINQVYNTALHPKHNYLHIRHKCLNYINHKSYSLEYYNLIVILHFIKFWFFNFQDFINLSIEIWLEFYCYKVNFISYWVLYQEFTINL